MATWKELGEVPDSEDEDGFESQDAEDAQFVQLATTTIPSMDCDGEKDIWDFPDSDGENDDTKAQKSDPLAAEAASPSPTPPNRLDSWSPSSVRGIDLDCQTPSQNGSSKKSTHATEKAASDPISPRIPSGITRIEVLIGTHSPSPTEKSRAPTQVPHTPQSVEDREAHQIAVRHERSLRPRKPIQEHPYLLENVQYSTFLRERGVRPLKIAEPGHVRTVNSPRDAEPEKDTQEDYLPEETDESQQRDTNDALEGHDGISLSSSPTEKSPSKSRAGISSLPNSQETHGTSIMEQDLPDVEQLLNRHSLPQTTYRPQSVKRKDSQPQSTTRKRQRQEVVADDVWNVDSSGPSPTREMRIDNDLTPTRGPHIERTTASPVWSLDTPPRLQLPVIQVSSEDEGDGQEKDTPAILEIVGGQSESEKDELVTKMGRRIKGVLPASWLRLDQQSSRDKTQQDIHRKQQQQSRPHDREIRRGVAQPRHAVASSTLTSLPFEESDEDEQNEGGGKANSSLLERTTDDVFHRQTRLDFEPQGEVVALSESPPLDDADSVIEDDPIDFMMPGRKRQRRLPETIDGHRKRVKKPVTYDRHSSVKRPKQPQITSLFQSQGSSSTKNPEPQRRQNPTIGKRRKHGQAGKAKNASRKSRAPLLSILDVIQPDAPSFLRIAARTARRRLRKGRSSLQGKTIKLATRRDNVDAASVLEDWRSGTIRQRPSVTASCPPSRRYPQPLEPLSEHLANTMDGIHSLPQSATRESKPRKLERSISRGGSASYRQRGSIANLSSQGQTRVIGPAVWGRGHPILGPTRPAQLEVAETEQPRVLKFHMLKKILDRLYKEPGQKGPRESSVEILDGDLARQSLAESPEPEQPEQRHDGQGQRGLGRRSKHCRRKQKKPRRVDVEAPQYTHADDPLPTEKPASRQTSETQPGGKKLQGLGPYGIVYTHHFEVFPFDPGVYFHESTVIGSGAIDACLGDELSWKMRTARPRISFHLGEQVLRWGPWDDVVSSELGIVFDFIAEQMESSGGEAPSPEMRVALDAAGFVFRYIKDAFSLDEDSPVVPFVARLRKILSGFCDRIGPRIKQLGRGQHANGHEWPLRLFDWLLLVSLQVLRICQADALLMEEQFRMEEVLKSAAGMLLSILVSLGPGRLTDTYERLVGSEYRQRGLRDDEPACQSWTLAMRILEVARIPRSSFWDLLGEAINVSQAISGVDVGEYERVWETVFQLLPLSEFSNSGIVVAGKRHETTADGWGIPQKLLKRVFELYQADDRQGPSFNNYCRALVGRCHYLLRQWGWRRSAPILGVIFDFFGSQNLAHLRNEEVYRSPNFLEHLATEPSLEVEADDRCFHIFLKLLALSIRELARFGSDKDIRNLVARTIPNHNRLYLKEQNVHERDLAALRNHHDLIGTLYWACPPKLRPSVTLIERLVSPESSHKEACLINIRAWSQLARFVVASGEATTLPRYLGSWRNSFFHKMLQQLESVASDIQQQLCSLSRDVSKSVSKDMVDAMIAMNKAAVRELLHASMTASLDVMRHAPDLEAASFCLSIPQLQQVFSCFCTSACELDWTMLRTALATLDLFLAKVEDFKDNEGSQQSESQILISAQADDALMAVDNDLARSFFLMARTILSNESSLNAVPAPDRQWCVEEILLLAARLGIRFIDGGIMRLSDMFKPGKYGVFTDLPTALDLEQRRYLPLFISNLLRQGFSGFADAKFSLAGVWALSIVKPRRYLEYENRLAEQLQRQGREFVPEAVMGLGVAPDYNSNRDLFEFAIASMRRTVRDAGPSLKKILVKEHAGILGSVMAQIKADLKLVVSWGDPEHRDYVGFVQAIIALIKVHGGEICAVDDFFYKISREYSPSKGDPQLQVAGMMSYGLRLQEGDGRMAYQLFYLLLTNFKFAVASNKLDDDVDVLVKGLKQGGIFSFILGKMLPAVMRASLDREAVLVLLDVHVHAMGVHLESSAVGPEVAEKDLPNVVAILRVMMDVLGRMSQNDALSWGQLHLLRQTMTVGNFIWPSLYVLSLSRPENACWGEIREVLQQLGSFVVSAREHVSRLVQEGRRVVETGPLFRGLAGSGSARFDAHVVDFTRDLVDDVGRNWVVSEARIDIQAPGQPRTQGGEQGVERPVGDMDEVIGDLYGRVREWLYWAERFGLIEVGVEVYEPLFI